jgi:hypothetical protein
VSNRVAINWARRPWLAVVLLAAFLARGLIPAGFMPHAGGLVICHGYVPTAAAESRSPAAGMWAAPGTHDRTAPGHDGASVCPFAAAATALAAPAQAPAMVLVHGISITLTLPVQRAIPRGTIVPTRLPRGPPALV